MRSFDGVAHFSVSSGNSFPMTLLAVKRFVYLFEIFLANSSALVDKEKTRLRHSLVILLASELRTLKLRRTWELGSASIGNPILCRLAKSMRIGCTVIADRRPAEGPAFSNLSFAFCQLHELRFAKGSPICGAEEKDNRAFWTFQCSLDCS